MEFIYIILELLLLFLIKVFDNILSTCKTILIQKNKGIFAGMFTMISSIIFYVLIDAVNDSSNNITMYIISLASGVGTFFAIKLSNKFSKERTFVNIILSDNKEEMAKFRDFLKEYHITNLTTDSYTKDWKKTYAITAYAETKNESKLIDNYIKNSNIKFKRIVQEK